MLTVLLTCLSLLFAWCSSDGLESWSTGGNLAVADRNQYAAWNGDSYYSDCLWVFGGNTGDDIYCYNITTDTVQLWDDLDPTNIYGTVEASVPASVLLSDGVNDYIYYMTTTGFLMRYHINDKNLTELTSDLNAISWVYPCIVQNPADSNQLLMVEGNYLATNNFAIWSISTGSLQYGQNLPTAVQRPVCVIVNNNYFSSDPYWFVTGFFMHYIYFFYLL